FQQESNWPLTF
nr:immunoglobulin light chain junction region [Macaca mulatta]